MSPIDIATAWHNARCTDYSFSMIFDVHTNDGYVILTPYYLLLARRVSSTWTDASLRTPWHSDPAGDSIFIWLQIGTPILSLRSLIPPGVRFLIYHRGPRLIRRRLSPRFHTAE